VSAGRRPGAGRTAPLQAPKLRGFRNKPIVQPFPPLRDRPNPLNKAHRIGPELHAQSARCGRSPIRRGSILTIWHIRRASVAAANPVWCNTEMTPRVVWTHEYDSDRASSSPHSTRPPYLVQSALVDLATEDAMQNVNSLSIFRRDEPPFINLLGDVVIFRSIFDPRRQMATLSGACSGNRFSELSRHQIKRPLFQSALPDLGVVKGGRQNRMFRLSGTFLEHNRPKLGPDDPDRP